MSSIDQVMDNVLENGGEDLSPSAIMLNSVEKLNSAVQEMQNFSAMLVEKAQQLANHERQIASSQNLGHFKLGVGFEIGEDNKININGTADFNDAIALIEEAVNTAQTTANTAKTNAATAQTTANGKWTKVVASETAQGIVERATQAEVTAGTDTIRYITPKTLQGRVVSTATWAGVISKIPFIQSNGAMEVGRYIDFHTNNSTQDFDMRLDCESANVLNVSGGTLEVGGSTVITNANSASATAKGIVELATSAEVATGTDATRVITPATLLGRTATTSRAGLIEIATQAEVTAGTATNKAVVPAYLKSTVTTSGVPDWDNAVSINTTAGNTYTVSKEGYVYVSLYYSTSYLTYTIDGVGLSVTNDFILNGINSDCIRAGVGQKFKILIRSGNNITMYFVPLKGVV